ncbi:MAG: TIGR02391 family protein [Nitrospinae bacterium CG11_big_fil_rev_8_21_14_0_20_45_15]|nr:MAG: TIGR02391 family protein [Nitrospinae bacterium CG11_big_fil_rev_8_21_14_0_20_45_15]
MSSSMTTNVNIELSDTSVKWIVGGACFLGVAYLFYKWVENMPEETIPLPKEAETFSNLPELAPKEFEELNFNEEVKEKAAKSFSSGDYVSAVRHSVICVFDIVRRKSGIDADSTTLIQTVFRGKTPKLVFQDMSPSHITNAENGIVDMLEGFAKSIRKVHMHATIEISKETALREISIACYLAEQVENYAVPAKPELLEAAE